MKNIAEKTLFSEIVRLIEMGIDRHLNRSILYSPFRVFYNLFKKSRPQLMNQVREMVRGDIEKVVKEVGNFNEEIFFKYNQNTQLGDQLMKKCYNIGIRLIKNELNVRLAFKAMRDRELQEKIYNYILEQVQNAVIKLLPAALPKANEVSSKDQPE